MSEENKPQLSLGTPPGKLKKQAAGGTGKLAWVLIGLQVLTIGFLALLLLQKKDDVTSGVAATSGEDHRAVAIQLEDKSLAGESARAWEKYLDQTPDAEDRAEVLYRVGKLYLQAEEYGPAAAAFVRCEQAAGEDEELKRKVGTQFVTCLRRLGLYGEVGRELSRRVEAGADDVGQGRVLATLAGETLTDDLERETVDWEDRCCSRNLCLRRVSDLEVSDIEVVRLGGGIPRVGPIGARHVVRVLPVGD
jgi:hypothetical protein